MKKTIDEVRDYLLENRVVERGYLDLDGLDFSDFDGDIYMSGMKVKRDLLQNNREVNGDLYQGDHYVRGNLYQGQQYVQGHLYQSEQKVKGNLYQSKHEVQGDYFSKNIKVSGYIYFDEPTKTLKKITADELKEMGYELV